MTQAESAQRADGPTRPWLKGYADGVDWHTPLAPRLMHGVFDDTVARFSSRPCCDFLGREWTYAEVAAQIDRAAAGLAGLGVAKGTRVALMLPNIPQFIVALFAVFKAGGVVVNCNPLSADREIAYQIDDSGAEVMITVDLAPVCDKAVRLLKQTALRHLVVCSLAEALPFPKSVLYPVVRRKDVAVLPKDGRILRFRRLLDAAGPAPSLPMDPQDLAVLQYTGGTTGVPKAAMLTHANLCINAQQSMHWFVGMVPGQERLLAVIPFFHIFALTVALNLAVMAGAEIVMLPRFELTQVLETIQRKRPTLFPAVPTIFTAINHCPDRDRYDLASIRLCISGGAPLPMEVKETFERLTGAVLFEGYGLTEAAPVVTCNPVAGLNKAGSIGQPVPGTHVEIVSADDGTTVLAPGETGEVCVTGPQVMPGYWRQTEETAATLRNGRLHTGDLGYQDEDGYFYIVDRIKDIIICSGYNVYPRQVEEAIYQHPAVAECVVAGPPDDYRGQTVKAYVALRPGQTLTLEALKDFLADKLSTIEQPKMLEIRDSLPRTLVGKLSRKLLLDEEEARRKAGTQPP